MQNLLLFDALIPNEIVKESVLDINLLEITALIDTIGLIQGIIIGLLLLFVCCKKRKALKYLGLFILVFSIELIPAILNDLCISKHHQEWLLFPSKFYLLTFPLYYIYLKKIAIHESERINLWLIIPGCIEIVLSIIIFSLPPSIKETIAHSTLFISYINLAILFNIVIGTQCLLFLKKQKAIVQNDNRPDLRKHIIWNKISVILLLSLCVGSLIGTNLLPKNDTFYFILSVMDIMILIFIAYRGIISPIILTNDSSLTATDKKIKSNTPVNTPVHTDNSSLMIYEKLNDYINQSQVYTISNLSVLDIANSLNIHPRMVSKTINNHAEKNFNQYINSFRIKKAKEILTNPKNNNLSIEGIGQEVGFMNRSSFYRAFKSNVGLTPAQYKLKHNKSH